MKKINESKVKNKKKVYNPGNSLHSEATKIKCKTKAFIDQKTKLWQDVDSDYVVSRKQKKQKVKDRNTEET